MILFINGPFGVGKTSVARMRSPGASRDPAFGAEVPTDGLTPAEVAGRILESAGTPTG
jgi:hypothetical protein